MRLIDCYVNILAFASYLRSYPDKVAGSEEDVVRELQSLLESGDERATKAGFPPEDIGKARFAVCAYVDETIMLSDWEGRTNWAGHSLQRNYFNTSNAGEEFFTNLEGLSPNNKKVREVYATCLALGFKGRYWHESETPRLNGIADENLRRIWGDSPVETMFPNRIMFPGAYPDGSGQEPHSGFVMRPKIITLTLALGPPVLLASLYIIYRFALNKYIFDFLHTAL